MTAPTKSQASMPVGVGGILEWLTERATPTLNARERACLRAEASECAQTMLSNAQVVSDGMAHILLSEDGAGRFDNAADFSALVAQFSEVFGQAASLVRIARTLGESRRDALAETTGGG